VFQAVLLVPGPVRAAATLFATQNGLMGAFEPVR
jgi:hypothetical protein